ncbi:fungal-specific transcription factor domain-containing protein [Annulohypoxylon bovei var. microspora]|nr:fungal-specific transcription factor domain-containing protein [Annulohypoxylon bovei var. microspora]
MFYTFASSPGDRSSRPGEKRSKVSRACNYCRQHRVRCDAASPCSRCLANNIECVAWSSGYQPPESLRISQDDSLSSQNTIIPSSQATSPSPAVSRSEGIDSTVGFMSKITNFCSTISQLSSNSVDGLPPPYPSADGQLLLDEDKGPSTMLSKSQLGRLLDIYWARYHSLIPILNRSRVVELFEPLWDPDDCEKQSVPLIDGITALCLKYLDSSGLNHRLLGLRWEQGDPSLAYFRRCVAAAGRLAAFAEPCLDCLQCYVLMTLYLLDAGEHQSAYNMVGLALRISQALNLHHGLPDSDPNTHIARRIWWTILQLNFRCARLLGRPVGVQLTEITCQLPPSNEFTYHTQALALTKTILAVTEALSQRPSHAHGDRIAQIRSRASALSSEVRQLLNWRDQQLLPIIGRPLHVDNREACEWIYSVADASPSQVLHSTLLELQYYDEIIGLHRPFICFPNGLLNSQHIPRADDHATTSLNHAIATVDLTYRIMSTTDVLFGRSDVYQWLWNALLTLIGFLMAYPFCIYAPTARHHAQLCLEVFTAADPRNIVALRAAAMTSSLCAKVDTLVEMLKSDRQQTPSSNGENLRNGGSVNSSTPADPSHPNSDALWSWTEMTNPDMWSAYSDEITGVLADFPSLPFDNDGFSFS